jgi:hypothetical protein
MKTPNLRFAGRKLVLIPVFRNNIMIALNLLFPIIVCVWPDLALTKCDVHFVFMEVNVGSEIIQFWLGSIRLA